MKTTEDILRDLRAADASGRELAEKLERWVSDYVCDQCKRTNADGRLPFVGLTEEPNGKLFVCCAWCNDPNDRAELEEQVEKQGFGLVFPTVSKADIDERRVRMRIALPLKTEPNPWRH